jgi:hypothetical protein
MAKIVYDEWYGQLTYAQRACYRKYNVPPAMHQDLVARFGENPDVIVAFIKRVVAERGSINYGDI